MKYIITLLLAEVLIMVCPVALHAQDNVNIKPHNFKYFTPIKKEISTDLAKASSEKSKWHPEYGVLPFNKQCNDCEEVLDKRTLTSRYFLEKGTKGRGFYIQQAYGPLHYKDRDGRLITLDPHLVPDDNTKGYYHSNYQAVTSFYDEHDHSNGLLIDGVELKYNQHLVMYFMDATGQKFPVANANKTNTTVGDEGSYTTDIWPGVDMEALYKVNGIETNYHINQKPQLPATNGWLVIEDRFAIPQGCKIVEDTGRYDADKNWTGGYLLVNSNNRVLAQIHSSYFNDDAGRVMGGTYRLTTTKDSATLSLLVPTSFLNNPNIKYPLFIDPYVQGFDSVGQFWMQGFPPNPSINGATMGFTNSGLGCPHPLSVTVPGKCTLYDVYIDLEYKIGQAPVCPSNPSDGSFKCQFLDLVQRLETPCLRYDSVGCFTGATQPYDQTCTTDPAKITNATAIHFPYSTHPFACIPPQCPDYSIPFTLYNRSFRCPDNCSFNCATGTYFALTVRGKQLEDTITVDKQVVCAGAIVHLTNFPAWGVPPFTYQWNFTSTDSATTDNPFTTGNYYCTVTDSCGIQVTSNVVVVGATASPATAAGTDRTICQGTQTTLGGSPTAPAGDTIQWTADATYAQAWINNATDANPTFTPPPDSAGTYLLHVRAADTLCYRVDDILVIVQPPPHATVAPNPAKICDGNTIDLATVAPYAGYVWSTGATTQKITVTAAGVYSVTVTDDAGCTGTSNADTATVYLAPVFTLTANPDTVINYGDSTILAASIDLTANGIQSYLWYPTATSSCTHCPDPTVTPTAPQYYTLEVTSTDGCTAKDSILIIVHYPNKYWIANAFSPNNDGSNDKFYIRKESGVTVTEFRIFDRWGNIIHDAATRPWDGTSKTGTPAPQEVYTYYFSLQFVDGHKEIAKGNVTLIR